ncbi:MAG TPA: hypothetical protein DDW27_13810 [Bacteroidales bacterium]|nr:hypothetical protein [Bacteroidales bacterium]
MTDDFNVPEPLLFNPLKHYLHFIKAFTGKRSEEEKYPGSKEFIKDLKHLGSCVMDVYRGDLSADQIFSEIKQFLFLNHILSKDSYGKWAGISFRSYRTINLSDGSRWTLKYYDNESRYIHIFPARSSPFTFRIKANTLKSAILYQVFAGKDYVSEDDLNKVRALAGLSPIREIADVEAITEMIEMLRV